MKLGDLLILNSVKIATSKIKNDEDFVKATTSLIETARKIRNQQNKNRGRKNLSRDDFYVDEDVLHLGPPFTLTPPFTSP